MDKSRERQLTHLQAEASAWLNGNLQAEALALLNGGPMKRPKGHPKSPGPKPASPEPPKPCERCGPRKMPCDCPHRGNAIEEMDAPYNCQYCPNKYRFDTDLSRHLAKHGVRSKSWGHHPCPDALCNKIYVRVTDLCRHILAVHGATLKPDSGSLASMQSKSSSNDATWNTSNTSSGTLGVRAPRRACGTSCHYIMISQFIC